MTSDDFDSGDERAPFILTQESRAPYILTREMSELHSF